MASTSQAIKSPIKGWLKLGLPQSVEGPKQSTRFVKRLVAIGVSQILFLRTDFDDSCFREHQIGSLDLRMLKASPPSEEAKKINISLKNAMEALELGYLRQIIIVFAQHKGKPDEAYETYTFDFNKQTNKGKDGSTGFSLVQTKNSKKALDNKENEINILDKDQSSSDYSIVEATKKLLQGLVVAMQHLDELPESYELTINLGYHEDITPPDYEPKGFMSVSEARHVENPKSNRRIGEIKSQFHELQLSMASKALSEKNTTMEMDRSHSYVQECNSAPNLQNEGENMKTGPSADGDNQKSPMDDGNENNSSSVQQAFLPSPKHIPVSRYRSATDTFREDLSLDDFQPKASIHGMIIRI